MKIRSWGFLPLVALLFVTPARGQDKNVEIRAPGVNIRISVDTDESEPVERAVATLVPVGNSGVEGKVAFRKKGKMIHITGKVTGLKPGKHGFHVHQYGDLSDREQGQSAGGHYNPTGRPHGTPEDRKRHVGDLGNITANENGVAEIDMKDSMIQLSGRHSILGRSLVVHADPDQFTQPSGGAGARVAFGVIGIAQSEDEASHHHDDHHEKHGKERDQDAP